MVVLLLTNKGKNLALHNVRISYSENGIKLFYSCINVGLGLVLLFEKNAVSIVLLIIR